MPELLYLDTTDPAHPVERVFQGPTQFQGSSVSFALNQFTTPRLTDLTGTVFTVAASVPGATTIAAVSPSVASTAPTLVPVQAASFQSTSQLTLTLEPSEASQVSSGLSTLSTDSAGGGGGSADNDQGAASTAAALVQFLFDELQLLPKFLLPNVGAGAAASPRPTAQPPTPSSVAPQGNAMPTEQQRSLSALDLFLSDPAPNFDWFEPTIFQCKIKAADSPSRIDGWNPNASAKEAAAYAAAAVGAGLYLSEREKRRSSKGWSNYESHE